MRGEKIELWEEMKREIYISKSCFNKIEVDRGSIKIKKVEFSFFDQSGEQFDDKKTIKKNLIPSGRLHQY